MCLGKRSDFDTSSVAATIGTQDVASIVGSAMTDEASFLTFFRLYGGEQNKGVIGGCMNES